MVSFIEYVEFINESLDNPYATTEDRTLSNSDRATIKHNTGVDDYREYSINAPSTDGKHHVLSVFKKRGAYEIHHELEEPETQTRSHSYMVGDKPNPRFVATILHHAKALVDSGNSVRIVGRNDNGMFDHYHKIGKIIARRNGYNISGASLHDPDNVKSKNLSEFTITKKH